MRILVDAMGGDLAPDEIVKGAVHAQQELGAEIVRDLFQRSGVELGEVYNDCGLMLFDLKKQDVHCGGSGCGCSAAVMCAHFLPAMQQGKYRNILFMATGALMSPTSSQQGQSIPGICHAVAIETAIPAV